jgi:hypothetical protein
LYELTKSSGDVANLWLGDDIQIAYPCRCSGYIVTLSTGYDTCYVGGNWAAIDDYASGSCAYRTYGKSPGKIGCKKTKNDDSSLQPVGKALLSIFILALFFLFFGGIWGFHRYGLFTRYCGRDPFENCGKKGKEEDSTSNNETDHPPEIEANYKDTALVGANMVTPSENCAAPGAAFNVYTMANNAATMASTITCGSTDTTIPPDSQGSNTITATVAKASREEKLGIGLTRALDGVFSVSRLSSDSPFHKTDLAIGMVVKTINGIAITGEESGFPTDILKGSVGQVTIVAEKSEATEESWSVPPADSSQGSNTITAIVAKASREETLGIGLSRALDGVFSVSRLLSESPFKKTDLAIGMVVKSINGMDITGEDIGFPMDILRGSVGQVTIVAENANTNEEDMAWWIRCVPPALAVCMNV